MIEIEVVYALPDVQTVIVLQVPAGSNVDDALTRSRIGDRYPQIDWNAAAIGIFGKRVTRATLLKPHDRVEIYRPLSADPKQARRSRARRRGVS